MICHNQSLIELTQPVSREKVRAIIYMMHALIEDPMQN